MHPPTYTEAHVQANTQSNVMFQLTWGNIYSLNLYEAVGNFRRANCGMKLSFIHKQNSFLSFEQLGGKN